MKSQEKYRALFENANDALYLIDPETTKIIDCNRKAAEMDGYSVEELKNMTIMSLHPDDERAILPEKFKEVSTKGSVAGIGGLHHVRKDGGLVHIEVSAAAIEIEGKMLNLSIVRDVTERKRTEEALLEKERLLSESQRIAHIGSWVYDLAGRIPWSDEMYRIYGVSPDTFTPNLESFLNLIHPDDRPSMRAWIDACLAGEKPGELVFRSIMPDGAVRFISGRGELQYDAENRPAYIAGTAQDITERKKVEKALQESEARMRSVFEQANDGIYIISAENRYLDANESGLKLLGYTRDELLHMSVADVLSPHEVARLAVEPPKMMSGIPHLAEWDHIRKDGSMFPGEVSARRLNDHSYLAIVRDLTERRHTEKTLRESEERLRLSTELANVAVWEYSFITNSMSRSTNHDKLYGLEWQTKWDINTFLNATHPDDRELSNEIIQKSVSSGGHDQYTFDFRVVYPDKSIHNLMVIGQVIERNSEGEGIIVRGCLIDITERKRAEEALKESEWLLRETGRIAKIGGWEFDPVTLKGTWTEEVARIHDLDPREETNAEKGLSFYHGEYRKKIEAAIKETIEFGKPYDLELELVTAKGTRKWVRTIGEPVRDGGKTVKVRGSYQDITERRRIEMERDRLFNLSIDMMCIAGFDGYFKQLNPAWEKTLGWTNEELMSKPFREFVHPDDREPTINAARSLSEGRTVITFDNRYICKDGSYKWISWSSYPLVEEKLIFAVVRDITERRLTEGMRIENVRLVSASKAKSDFLANMSHELRTPLNAIIGFSQLLKMKTAGELNEKQYKFVEDIIVSGNHLLALISDILDLSKVEAGKIELVVEKMSIPDSINEGLTLIKEKAMKHRIALKVELDPRLEYIEADRLRFKQILFNLLSNAVKFSKPEGGVVTITAKKEEDMAKFSVSDTGIGIREENLGKLFREFEQLDTGISRKYGGTGLGLAITKKLVELHGGKITAESTFGEGSTFTFILPVEKEEIK